MLRRKSELQGDTGKPQANRATLERARLMQARTLALRRNDKVEAAMLDAQLAELAVESPPVQSESTEDTSALLAKVNERNRKANQEAIRRAELQEAERKRRERRLGTPTASDPSARLRTVPRMFASRYGYPSLPVARLHGVARLRLRRVSVQVYYTKPWRVALAGRVDQNTADDRRAESVQGWCWEG
jgi:RNA polymerase-associated protein RTF1